MKVAIGTWETPPTLGGPAYYIKELVERLSNYVEVKLIVPNHSSIKQKNGLELYKLGSYNIPIIRVCMFAARASSLVKNLDVDLVHDNGVLGFSNFSPFLETWHHGNIGDRNYLSTASFYLSSYREWLTLMGIKKAKYIMAISSRVRDELINLYSISPSKIHVVPHGVDVDFFKPISSNQLRNYSKVDNTLNLLYVGALSIRKNIHSLIQALKLLVYRYANIHLLIVGSGEKGQLEKLVANLNLKNNVSFLGGVSREKLVELYNIADYVVLPSFKEGFGMTILEALSCEKPVIMTPVGISNIIEDNNLGIVAHGFTPSSIASAIILAIDKGNFRNLRKFVKENFTWDKTLEKTLEVYKLAINAN